LAEQIDISDFFQNRLQSIAWNVDTIRMTIMNARSLNFEDSSCIFNVFRDVGICELKPLSSIEDIEDLLNYYLVWYKPNQQGRSGVELKDSKNYLFHEYVEGILTGSDNMIQNIYPLIKSLKELTSDIDIIIAYDTFIKKGLIIDGTRRALSLYYIKHTNKEQFTNLLNSTKYSIKLIYMKSNVCRILFPLDFCKLISLIG
jgi:hypothetical protein